MDVTTKAGGPLPQPGRTAASMARRALPGLCLGTIGAGLLALALDQPAWLGANVGPGLMAQWLGKGVLVLGLLWVALSCLDRRNPGASACAEPAAGSDRQAWSGPALLGAVLLFALALPLLGLVASAGIAAAAATLGAGERRVSPLLLTAISLAALTTGIGLTLLPPTAPLWPSF